MTPIFWHRPVFLTLTNIAEQAVSADQVLYNFILSIRWGDPKQTPYSLVTFLRSFTLVPFQKIKTLCYFRGANIHQERTQTARVTSSILPSISFRRWAFPPQNIYERKDLSFFVSLWQQLTNRKPQMRIIDWQVYLPWKIGPPTHVPNFSTCDAFG